MARIAFFTVYGAIVGAAFSSLLLHLNPQNRLVATVVGLVGSIFYGLAARTMAKKSRMTVVQGLIGVPLTPFAFLGLFVGFAALCLLMIVVFPIGVVTATAHERRLRAKLNAQGRLINVGQLQQRLTAGEGTLIEEWGLHGPYRVWWTRDDLLAKGLPSATDAVFFALVDGQDASWHPASVKEYLDADTGRASLALVGFRRIRKLRRLFPDARIALMAPSFIGAEPPLNKPEIGLIDAARPSS